MTIDNEVLYKKYNIDIELYRGMPIDFDDLRIRTANCLKGAGVFDIDSLLSMSYDKLSSIKSLGILSLNDIEEYVKKLDSKTEEMMERMDILMTSRIKNRRDLIYSGEFTEELYEGISEYEQRTIDELKIGFDLLDHDLIVLCRENPALAYDISSMLKRFTVRIEKYKELDKLYDSVKGKINNRLKTYYEVYPIRESMSEEFKDYCDDGGVLLGSLFDKAKSSAISTEEKIKFVKWASYDLKEELTSFLNGFYERSANAERVLLLRSRKCTLQEIGDELGITRERVRQIEKKVVQPFCRWQRNKKFLPRLSAEFNGETIIESTELQEYFDETTETPVANYETGEYEENLRLSLSTSDENAVIYYYLNDDETTEAIYTKPITIDKTCSVTYYATSFGKNDSDKETKYYCINKSGEPSDWMPYNDLPQEVKDNPSEYALEQEDGYRYKDTTETSSASEAAALEYEDWQQESAAYTDYTEWQDEEIAVDDSLIGFEVDTQEVPDTTKTRYQYSHYKYVDNGETKFAKNAVEGFDCEYEEIIVDSRLSIAGFTDDNVSYYSYNDEQWFTQTKVSGVKTQYRSRHQVATYYRWTDWDIDTPSSEEQREYEEEEVYRYANKNYHIVTVLIPGTDSTNILLIEDGDIIPLTIFEEYGYSINGLYLSDDFSGEFDIETPIEDSLQLYINYVPKSFTVTFQMQDGSEIDTQSVSYLDAAVEPETDAVPGWVFNGWDKEFDCITEDTVVTGSYVKESEYAYVSLDRNTANMYQGNTLKLNATITPNNLVDEQLEWSSSNTGVATVDDNGNVTAVNEGTATITVRVVKTKESAECKLVIKADADHYLVLANNSTLNYDSLGYLRRVKLGATAEDVAKEFTNPLSDIKLFGFNGAELSPSKLVGTGTQIKLYNGDEATDTRTMIITGDMTGDGIINNRDVAMFNRYLVNKVTVEDFQALAVDVNGDGYVNNRDAAMIARYLVGKDRF